MSIGEIVWYDLMTTNEEAAKTFYTAFTGWNLQTWDGPAPYTMFSVGEQPIGGFNTNGVQRESWLAYVQVENLQTTVKKAIDLGAKILVEPMEIPNVGHFAVIMDAQGGVIAPFQPNQEASQTTSRHGDFCWAELMSDDSERSFAFYSELFGWVKTGTMDMGDQTYLMFGPNAETPIGGFMNKPPGVPFTHWSHYIKVTDLDEATTKAKEAGAKVVNGPMEIAGGGRFVNCIDPQGASFALFSDS